MISFHCRLQTADCFFTDWTLTGLTLRSCWRWWWQFDSAEAQSPVQTTQTTDVSWQLTLANGIMDNLGIDLTMNRQLEVGSCHIVTLSCHIVLHCVDLPQWYWLGTRDWDSGFGISSLILKKHRMWWWLMTQYTRHSCDEVLFKFNWSSNKTLS